MNAADVCYIRDKDGRIPLHIAAMKGRHEVIPHLVQACPESTRVKVDQGETILHLCAKHGRLKALMSVVELLSDDMEFVKLQGQQWQHHLASCCYSQTGGDHKILALENGCHGEGKFYEWEWFLQLWMS